MVAVERLTPLVLPECNPRTQPFEIIRLRMPAEGKHFHRQGMPGAEVGREFALVHHDDFPATDLGKDLLPEQRPSPALDQVELGIYFVGAYWGYGFHEDGVQSALEVARAIREER